MGDLLGKDHRAPVLDGSSSTRSGSCISAHTVNTSLPVAIADMMTPPQAGEEEANLYHEEKSKTNSNVNLQLSSGEPITGDANLQTTSGDDHRRRQ